MTKQSKLALGIDIGSTTAKIVVVEDGTIRFEKYQRHFSQVRQKTLELLAEAAGWWGAPFTAAFRVAGLDWRRARVPFVQRSSPREVVRRMERTPPSSSWGERPKISSSTAQSTSA